MGCFLWCFGGEKDRKRRKRRNSRGSGGESNRNRVQNFQQERKIVGEQCGVNAERVVKETSPVIVVKETPPANVVEDTSPTVETSPIVVVKETSPTAVVNEASRTNVLKEISPTNVLKETPPTNVGEELRNEPQRDEQRSSSPRKKVAFDSNVTTYDHVSVSDSIESLPDCKSNSGTEKSEDSEMSSQSQSLSEDASSVVSSVGSYPPNHRYHNARVSDDESEEYGDNDMDDLDNMDEEDDYDKNLGDQDVWSESILAASMESRTGNPSPEESNKEVQSRMVSTRLPNEEAKEFKSKTTTRDRSGYANTVLNPVENINQWKAAKSKGTYALSPQKENLASNYGSENLTSNYESPRKSFSSEPLLKSKKSDKNSDQEIAVDASLSSWLVSPETRPSFNDLQTIASGKTMSEGSATSAKGFEDRPILGALTVEELKQMSAYSSPKKSPCRSPDEMPIIGTVGTYWNDSTQSKRSGSASSYKGIPNTTSKYREDKRVNWHTTPFETRLERALNRVAATES